MELINLVKSLNIYISLCLFMNIYSDNDLNIYSANIDNVNSITKFINEFPFQDYKIYKVNDKSFYIDKTDDIIKGVLATGAEWEGDTLNLIRNHVKPGSVALDIGSHIGVHTITMAKAVGPTGKVYAFEPQPKIFRELYFNMKINQINNVFMYWAALSNERGVMDLTPLKPGNEGGTSLIHREKTVNKVPTIILDDLNLNNISFIKMDVEEMENMVIDSARETILRNKPIMIIEILGNYDYNIPKYKNELDYTIKKIQDLGYNVSLFKYQDWLCTPII